MERRADAATLSYACRLGRLWRWARPGHTGVEWHCRTGAGPEAVPSPPAESEKKRIAILGGGFAGMRVAEYLEEQLGGSAFITLVSDTNALLFTPMLSEHGLVVIGVHSPEFAFEKNVDNVRRAAKELRVDNPIAIDSDHVIWRAFKNEYWPALYFVDAQGHIRHHYFGEGEYEQSEMVIQQLLAEAGIGGIGQALASVDPRGLEAAADWGDLESSENYVGYERTENFVSPGGVVLDQRRVYTVPTTLRLFIA